MGIWWLHAGWLLAQVDEPPFEGPPLWLQWGVPMVGLIIFFYFASIRPEQARTAQRRERLKALKKNDKVVTIGGIYAVVDHAKPDDDVIVLKIDEARDVKIKVTRAAIARVITVEGEEIQLHS